MQAAVTFRTPDGARHTLGPGDLIGRLWSAALSLDDDRVSEAHCMVSLRGSRLKLLALRGLFSIDGRPRKETVLEAGMTVALARDLDLFVEEVTLPAWVLGLGGDGLPTQPLGGVCALVLAPHPKLVTRSEAAVARFWSTGAQWRVRTASGVETLEPGWTLTTDAGTFRAVRIALSRVGAAPTSGPGRVEAPMRIVCHWDMVHLHRDGEPVTSITGHGARVISELAEVGEPIGWEALARILWPEPADRHQQRRRWDVLLARLRRRLRADGIRATLVQPDGTGNFQLLLRDGDTVEVHN